MADLERLSDPVQDQHTSFEAKVKGVVDFANRGLRYAIGQREFVHPNTVLAKSVIEAIPEGTFPLLRTKILRATGYRGIDPSARFAGMPELGGWGNIYERLHIGAETFINTGVHFDLNGEITVGRQSGLGNGTFLQTTNHELNTDDTGPRFGAIKIKPIAIGDRVWIGANVTVGPGVTIADGSVIGMGSFIIRNVPENTMVLGNPAMVVGQIIDGQVQRMPQEAWRYL